MAIIELNNVHFTYNAGREDETPAVRGVSLTVSEGEFVAIVGHNGSGKSTIAKLMNGLLLPDEGSVTVDGMSTADDDKLFDIRSRVGVVFQNPDNQMVATIIEDDVAFGPENLGLPPEKIRERVDWSLKSVGMYDRREGTPFRLSGGQKQRVAIAGVLALKPKVMVLDESTSMLDPVYREEVMTVVKKLNREEGMAVVAITHFMEEALEADKIVVMDDGKVFAEGGKEIFEREAELEKIGLSAPLACRISHRLREKGIDLPPRIVTESELVAALTGKT